MTNLTRVGKNSEKKTVSASAVTVKAGDVADASNELFVLPPNALIVASYCIVKVAGQASLTVDFGFDGGAELGNDLDIDGAAVVEGLADAGALDTGTGKTVTALFSATPSAGEFVFIVEYVEYNKGCGDLTNLV
jgi:hypothetical protein